MSSWARRSSSSRPSSITSSHGPLPARPTAQAPPTCTSGTTTAKPAGPCERATQLNDLHADALRYRGPGTDLTVGLLSAARWMAGGGDTSTGIYYVANMPTEEVFTSPDARRTEGTIRSSLPLVLSGQVVRGLELTFEQGRAVRVEAETGADLVRSHFATIENADRLGEVALLTKESRVGPSATLFHDTLFDRTP